MPSVDGAAQRQIVVLSNLTPRSWLAETARQLGPRAWVVVSSPIPAAVLEPFERYQWVDHRRRQRRTLDRLAAWIGGAATRALDEPEPERLTRRVLPLGVRVIVLGTCFAATQSLGFGFAGLAGADIGGWARGDPTVDSLCIALGGAVALSFAVLIATRRITLLQLMLLGSAGYVVNAAATSWALDRAPTWMLFAPLVIGSAVFAACFRSLRGWLPPRSAISQRSMLASGTAPAWRLPATRGLLIATLVMTIELAATVPSHSSATTTTTHA